MKKCKRCLLPATVPEVEFDTKGICSFCNEYKEAETANTELVLKKRRADLEKAINDCKGKGEYDCLVPVSGGKDSIYLLYKLKVEYGLKVLAFTTNINIPRVAQQNIQQALKELNIDHISYNPSGDFYKRLFRYLLQNQEERGAVYTLSYVYAPLFEGDAIKTAMEKGITLVLAGYSPGQPEPERMLYEFSRDLICKTDWTPPELRKCNLFTDSELSRFFNPNDYPQNTVFPRYLAPYHAWDYNQHAVMNKIVNLKLVHSKKHASPIHSNYPINWLLMYSDLKNFGYNPYQLEFSELIRSGKASRLYWQVMTPIVNFMTRRMLFLGRNVAKSLHWLELTPEELKITRPKGAYDPVIST